MSGRFLGKSVFITGASSGIGASLALAFVREGARVGLAARRVDRLEELCARIEAQGGQAVAVVCDVTQRASVEAAVAKVAEAFGGIDVAVVNAGFGVGGPFLRVSTDAFRRQFDTNFFGAIDTVRAVLPHLIRAKGRLGLVSSVLGQLASPETGAYTASKFALVGLAETLYYELAAMGVTVTCIEPGIVESEFRSVDSRGVYHPEREDSAPKWLRYPTDKAARDIVRALYAGKFEAVITGHGKLAVALHRHFPRTFRLLARLLVMRTLWRKRGTRLVGK